MTRVILADDHGLLRSGIRALLEKTGRFEVTAEAATGHELLEAVREDPPDLAIVDIGMPGMNGIEATARITVDHPEVRVIVISMHDEEVFVMRALRAGAKAYLLKDSSLNELMVAADAVLVGRTYLSPAIAGGIVDTALDNVSDADRAIDRLSARQREVLQLVAEGHSSRHIADALSLSVRTVETHRRHIMNTLGIHDVAGLVRYAIRAGIVQA